MEQVRASILRSSAATEDAPRHWGNREFGLVRVHPVWRLGSLQEANCLATHATGRVRN